MSELKHFWISDAYLAAYMEMKLADTHFSIFVHQLLSVSASVKQGDASFTEDYCEF